MKQYKCKHLVLVCSGCYDKIPDGWLINYRNSLLIVLGAGSPGSRLIRCWARACFLFIDGCLLCMSSDGGRSKESLWDLFYTGSNFTREGSALMT